MKFPGRLSTMRLTSPEHRTPAATAVGGELIAEKGEMR